MKTFLRLFILIGCASAALQCKTSSSSLLDEETASEKKCMPDLEWYEEHGVKRLSTAELEQHIKQGVESGKWDCDFNVTYTSRVFGIPLPTEEGADKKAAFEKQGGYFGSMVDLNTPQGSIKLPINDHKMRYLWSEKGGAGQFLPPEKWYNHVIPMRYGSEQPELVKHLKDGDIIVYFHPEERYNYLDAYNQYRSTHSATILENKDEDGNPVMMTIDTPGAYATAISGADPTPFHVFRLVPRDESGQALEPTIANAYRQQISRWGNLALDRFEFEGNYDTFSFKSPDQVDFYALRFLATQFPAYDGSDVQIIPMYCAWYSYMNLNLAYMRPMNQSGMRNLTYAPPGQTARPFYDVLTEGDAGYQFPYITNESTLGTNHFKESFAAPESLAPHNDYVFPPATAPELVLNFLDRTIGPDVWVPDTQWAQHAGIKAGILSQSVHGFLDTLRTTADPRFQPGPGGPTENDYAAYNEQLEQIFQKVIQLYQESMTKTGDELKAARQNIQSKLWNLIQQERLKPRIPRKWVPPYIYIREADAFESFYRPASDGQAYQPKVVYVGTVVPARFLKEWGEEDPDRISALPETREVEADWTLQYSVREVLTESGITLPENKSPIDLLMTVLHSECLNQDEKTCSGLNVHEMTALMAMRNHWNSSLLWNEDLSQLTDQVNLHNLYGIDDTLMLRTLVSYWNNPADFRAAIYNGDSATIASAATNLRIIMGTPPARMVRKDERVLSSSITGGHPRRVRPMMCKGDHQVAINQQNLKCGDIVQSDY